MARSKNEGRMREGLVHAGILFIAANQVPGYNRAISVNGGCMNYWSARRTKSALISIGLVAVAWAAEPNVSDKFYTSIRQDDSAAVRQLLKDAADVNTPDGHGSTPLMFAAEVGSVNMMRELLAAGGDVNAKNSFGATALMWCADSPERVKLLVEKGAAVNARSKVGRTPLIIAAAHSGNLETVRLLVSKGAALDARDELGNTPLHEAARANDMALISFFLEKSLDPAIRNRAGITPLLFASGFGNLEAMKILLKKGADANAQSMPAIGPAVKNGDLGIGSLTPLIAAIASRNPAAIQLLLEKGANVDTPDVRGMTPMMLAVATDHPSEEIVRLLLERKPDVRAVSKAGETALAWAEKFRNPHILPLLLSASVGLETRHTELERVEPSANTDAAAASKRALALLQRTTTSFVKEGGCASCHSHNITAMATTVAREHGVPFDSKLAAEQSRETLLFFRTDEGLLQRLDPPASVISAYALTGMAFDGTQPDRHLDSILHNLAASQLGDGTFPRVSGIVRPPTSDHEFSTVAMAIKALRQFAPPARKGEFETRVRRSAQWLLTSHPETTEDCVMQLLGAHWAGIDPVKLEPMVRNLQALQREDGGWAQTPHLQSDAYATGTALFALSHAGKVASSSPLYRKGVRFLLRTQRPDGSWYVASRAPKFQPYFESGFPYGHDQWISQFATGWASMALSLASADSEVTLNLR
ncbi:MAG: ankyrin repeat domain-containing protein [Acidobacteriota bacterium]|nr:ankyrin repeat domain-containing protein [Acidobacteriota bacterium]